jgi:hypothetical protein
MTSNVIKVPRGCSRTAPHIVPALETVTPPPRHQRLWLQLSCTKVPHHIRKLSEQGGNKTSTISLMCEIMEQKYFSNAGNLILVAGIDIGGVLSSYGAQNTINHTLCNQLH